LAAKLDEVQQTLQQAKPLFQNRSLMFNNLIHLFKVVRSIKFSCIKKGRNVDRMDPELKLLPLALRKSL